MRENTDHLRLAGAGEAAQSAALDLGLHHRDQLFDVGIVELSACGHIGAAGIAVGLALFGPKLIQTVGTEITELDRTRAFCVALAAAITVIVASQLGLPVCSTHIAVGGVFGVGFFREYFTARRARVRRYNPGKGSNNNNGEIRRRRKLVRRAHLFGWQLR